MEFGSIPSSTKTVIIYPQIKLLQFSIFTIDPDVSQYPNIFVSANIFELKNAKIRNKIYFFILINYLNL